MVSKRKLFRLAPESSCVLEPKFASAMSFKPFSFQGRDSKCQYERWIGDIRVNDEEVTAVFGRVVHDLHAEAMKELDIEDIICWILTRTGHGLRTQFELTPVTAASLHDEFDG